MSFILCMQCLNWAWIILNVISHLCHWNHLFHYLKNTNLICLYMVVGQCTTVDLKSLTKLMYSILVATQAHTEWQMRAWSSHHPTNEYVCSWWIWKWHIDGNRCSITAAHDEQNHKCINMPKTNKLQSYLVHCETNMLICKQFKTQKCKLGDTKENICIIWNMLNNYNVV